MLRPYSDLLYINVPQIRHTNYRQYEKYINPYLLDTANVGTLMTSCLVREPISWLHSWYRYRSRYELTQSEHIQKFSTVGISFAKFIESYISDSPPLYASVGNQFDFVKNANDQVGVDIVFAYEKIHHFVEYMEGKVGHKLILGSLNISPKKVYKSKVLSRIDSIKRKINARITMLPPRINSYFPYESLPVYLVEALKEFISQDFKLYEMARNGTLNK